MPTGTDAEIALLNILAVQGYYREADAGRVVLNHPWWKRPFAFVEGRMEWLVGKVNRWAFLELLQRLATLSIAVGAIQFLWGLSKQRETAAKAAEAARKAGHYVAWQVINSAQGKGGSGGRIEALQDLARDSVSLAGVTLDSAWLNRILLPGADLHSASLQGALLGEANLQRAYLDHANLRSSNLIRADLRGANLSEAILDSAYVFQANLEAADLSSASLIATSLFATNLRRVDLTDGDLSGANLSGADLSFANLHGVNLARASLRRANLRGADLSDAQFGDSTGIPRDWLGIEDLRGANIAGIQDATGYFRRWALDSMGAVER